MIRNSLKKIDYRFAIILSIGITLQIISLIFADLGRDAYAFMSGAVGILEGRYNTDRPPTFPFFILIFYIFIGNSVLSTKLAAFTSGVLLIIASYIVFTKASLKIFGDDDIGQKKSKLVGLMVSFYISISSLFIINIGQGLRESTMSLLYILVFYFIFLVENRNGLRNNILLVLIVSALTLSHVTVGIFLFVSVICFFLITKLKFFKKRITEGFTISNIKVFLISLSFILSYLSWLFFCYFYFGDPFYTINRQKGWFEGKADTDMSSFNAILIGIGKGLYIGSINQFVGLLYSIGIVFTILGIIALRKYYKEENMLFLFVIIIINFFYLTFFMVMPNLYDIIYEIMLTFNLMKWVIPSTRLILYFYPFLFFIGSLILIDTCYEYRENTILAFNFSNKRYSLTLTSFFIGYLVVYSLRQLLLLNAKGMLNLFPILYDNVIDYILLFIFSSFLMIIILFSYHWKRNSKNSSN